MNVFLDFFFISERLEESKEQPQSSESNDKAVEVDDVKSMTENLANLSEQLKAYVHIDLFRFHC